MAFPYFRSEKVGEDQQVTSIQIVNEIVFFELNRSEFSRTFLPKYLNQTERRLCSLKLSLSVRIRRLSQAPLG
jgi:hypothetical protein